MDTSEHQEIMPDKIDIPDPPTNDDIPEEIEEDGIFMNAEDESLQAYAPPPRLAARFWRPSNNRRRSSATSSRRNSMSSTHSHSSARSLHGGCQSNHVAQHLRRASIIESRKARLADRAAHAEQVRLRAALNKAAPRGSNSEERALAAQKAREKHLAAVAATCAEEVRRAKKVAEDQKERKAAEEKRYRQEMEEKLAEAEKRRLQYNRITRRPRTSSSPSKKPAEIIPVLTNEAAARKIQSAWRTRRRRKTFEEFASLNLSIDQVRDTSFEAMGQFIAEENVLSATAKVLRLLNLLDSESTISSQTSTRTFLSAYLVLGHPAEVLSKDGDQEKDLITKAKEVVICFEALLTKIMATPRFIPDSTQLETLSFANAAYITAFHDWKARDASILIETMVASFVSLDAIWQSVKDSTEGEVANDYREGIRDNQVLLLSKIKKLAGPDRAAMLIKKAIRESRRSRARRRPVGDVRPRPAVEASSAPSEETTTEGSTSVSTPLSPDETSWEGQEAAALASLFSPLPENRIVVHELAIDKEFRLEPASNSDLRDAMYRDLCDNMRRGFENDDGGSWTVAMATNIREKLLRLLKQGNSMHTLISETLDPDFVARQCRQGVFSYDKFFSFMASILPKLCAPVRDEEVKLLAEDLETPGTLHEMVEKVFRLLHTIELLRLDYQNFLLMNAAPTLIKESARYEQQMFAQDLEAERITLTKTKRWWNDAAVNVITEFDRRDPLHRPTTQMIYARGLVDLTLATNTLQENDVPETFELDRARILRIRGDSLRISTTASILLTAKNLLKRDARSQWKPEANRMSEALRSGFADPDDTLPSRLLSIVESGHPMPAATKSQLSSIITRLLKQAQRGRLTDPLIKLVFQRLKTHVLSRLSASSSGERVRVASAASEGLASSGMPEFVTQVGEIVDTLTKMAEVDQKAHGTWYEQIAKEFEEMGQDAE